MALTNLKRSLCNVFMSLTIIESIKITIQIIDHFKKNVRICTALASMPAKNANYSRYFALKSNRTDRM